MKEIARKSKPALLSIIVWLIMILYHGVLLKPVSNLLMSISTPFVLNFTLHTLIQLVLICAVTILAVKKLGYKIEGAIISIPVMYLLFAIYSPESIYLFIYTGGLQIGFAPPQPPMHPLLASLFITLQYSIVILITTFAVSSGNKRTPDKTEEKQE